MNSKGFSRKTWIGLVGIILLLFAWTGKWYAPGRIHSLLSPTNDLATSKASVGEAQSIVEREALEQELASLQIQNDALQEAISREQKRLEAITTNRVSSPSGKPNIEPDSTWSSIENLHSPNSLNAARQYGQALGRSMERRYSLELAFPEIKKSPFTPPPGTDRYESFVKLYRNFIRERAELETHPLKANLLRRIHAPEARHQIALIDSEALIQALALDSDQAHQARKICDQLVDDLYQSILQNKTPFLEPFSLLKPILSPQQQKTLEGIYTELYPTR